MNPGSDIRIKVAFFQHPKTVKLAKKAGWEAVVRLQQLWGFASEYRADGKLSGLDDDDIAIAAGWTGETRVFIDALMDTRWLDGKSGNRELHDYEEHQPYVQERAKKQAFGSNGGKKAAANMTDKQKAERSSKAAKARWNSTTGDGVDAKDTKHELSIDAKDTKHGMLSPYHTIPNHTNTLVQENNTYPAPVEPAGKKVELKEPVKSEKQIEAEKAQEQKKAQLKVETDAVFTFWAEVMQKPGAKLSPKRKARIEWALKEYGQDRARKAIVGCASSAFHMGENENGKRFDDLELIFRNSEKIEAFEALGETAQTYVDAVTGATVVVVSPPEGRSASGGGRVQKPGCDVKGREFGIVSLAKKRGWVFGGEE